MAWTLQPRSYMQAIRPNFYSVAYKRNGAYKGMGWLGQSDTAESTTPITGGQCPGSPGCPGYPTSGGVPGIAGQCPGTPGCPGYVDPYQNLATLTEGVLAGQNVIMSTGAFNQLTGASVAAQPSTTPKWVVPVLAVVAILALVGGRTR